MAGVVVAVVILEYELLTGHVFSSCGSCNREGRVKEQEEEGA